MTIGRKILLQVRKSGHSGGAAYIIGAEWNQGTDTWTRIDVDGNVVGAPDFDTVSPWQDIVRCTLADDGAENEVSANGKGDDISLDGSTGRVMVRIPKFWVKSDSPGANRYRWWISSAAYPGFTVHPAFMQRGAPANGWDFIYVGAYDADFEYDGVDAAYNAVNEKLHSRTGKQPYTGENECIWSIPVDDLAFEPNIDDVISTPTEGGFFIVDYLKTAGAWGGGGAGDTAIIWLRKPGDPTCGMVNAEVLSNDTQANVIGNTIAGPAPRLVRITDCRTLAENIGAGWGIFSIWPSSAIQLLFYVEYAGADSQSLVGPGTVFLPFDGPGFYGLPSGFQNTDSDLGGNGTGVSAKKALCFDAGTTAFVATETVNGAGGGSATVDAVVVRSGAWTTNNAKGYLVVSSVTGTFHNNEALTGSIAGAATCDSFGEDGTSAPIAYRGIENLWGNIYNFIDGHESIDGDVGATDVKYRLINRDGSGTFANPMAPGDYEESPNLTNPSEPLDGDIKNIVYEELLKFVFYASDCGGSTSSYLYDYWGSHRAGFVLIMLAGSAWADALDGGVGLRICFTDAPYAARFLGARLEFTK